MHVSAWLHLKRTGVCMSMLGKLLNILNGYVKKVYSQKISLLFVFL